MSASEHEPLAVGSTVVVTSPQGSHYAGRIGLVVGLIRVAGPKGPRTAMVRFQTTLHQTLVLPFGEGEVSVTIPPPKQGAAK